MESREKARPKCEQQRPRPIAMPPRKRAVRKKSYNIGEVIVALALAVGLCVLSWGLGVSYQVGYHSGVQYAEANHEQPR